MTVYISWQPPDTPFESHWSPSEREELRRRKMGGEYHAYLILDHESETVSDIESSKAARILPEFQG